VDIVGLVQAAMPVVEMAQILAKFLAKDSVIVETVLRGVPQEYLVIHNP